MPAVDVVVLVAYFLGCVGLGCWFVRRSRSTEGFMVAGRSLPGWVVGLSIFGTYVSSISYIAIPGKAFGANWNPLVFSLSLPLTAWIATRFFIPLYRDRGEISAYSFLEARFGPWARCYASICYLLTQVVRTGAIMLALALPLESLLGWNVSAIILVTGISVTIYTVLGGIEAVIWTDVVQSIILAGGAVVAVAVILLGLPEGPGQLAGIAGGAKFSLGGFGWSWSAPTFWVTLLYGLVLNLQNWGIDQSYVQRYVTARSLPEARKSLWLGALAYVPISALFLLIGTGLYAYYTARPERLPSEFWAVGRADRVFPYFIVHELPTGMCGLLIAAIFAAAMSSISASLNSSATLILKDFYQRYFRKEAGERESMRVLYVSSTLFGVLGTAVALLLARLDSASLLGVWWKLSGIFGGGMLGLFLLASACPGLRSRSALVAVTVGALVIAALSLPGLLPQASADRGSPSHGLMTPVFGTPAILATGLLLWRLRRAKS